MDEISKSVPPAVGAALSRGSGDTAAPGQPRKKSPRKRKVGAAPKSSVSWNTRPHKLTVDGQWARISPGQGPLAKELGHCPRGRCDLRISCQKLREKPLMPGGTGGRPTEKHSVNVGQLLQGTAGGQWDKERMNPTSH